MNNSVIRPVGPVMDHPIMQDYQFLVELNRILAPPCFDDVPMMLEMMANGRNWVRGPRQTQFLVHTRDYALMPHHHDPLERGVPRVPPPVEPPASEDSINYFENTSLEAPDALPENRLRLCRAQTAARRRFMSTWYPANHRELRRMIENERKERKRIHEVNIILDKLFDDIKDRKAQIPAAKAKLAEVALAWWKSEDEKDRIAYLTWEANMSNAFKCSKSMTRVWHIASWHNGPTVPEDVMDAVIEVADLYTEISLLEYEQEEYDISIGNEELIRFDTMEELLSDDAAWVLGYRGPILDELKRQGTEDEVQWFGEDIPHLKLTNGFCDYVAKGKGAKMAEHAVANLNARKVRLHYAGKREVKDVFTRKAEQVLNAEKIRLHAEDEGKPNFKADVKAVAEAHQTMVDYRVELNGTRKSKERKQSKDVKDASGGAEVPDSWEDAMEDVRS